MFEKIKEDFYESLIKSIKARKKFLKLTQEDMLRDPKRVSKILNIHRDKNHPYLIGPSEYPRLNYLFLCKDNNSFKDKNDLFIDTKDFIKKCGNNYDEMLWGHIDWDKMFRDTITELSKLDESEELGELFEDTLVDYAPYANIKYEGLRSGCAKIFYSEDEKDMAKQYAIIWAHLRHGSGLFKQTFYEKFSGKTLKEFDKEFSEFISKYLEKRKPNDYSLGLQVCMIHKNISGYEAKWRSIDGVQWDDVSDEESGLAKLLREYVYNGRNYIKKLEECQQKFDALHVDIQ